MKTSHYLLQLLHHYRPIWLSRLTVNLCKNTYTHTIVLCTICILSISNKVSFAAHNSFGSVFWAHFPCWQCGQQSVSVKNGTRYNHTICGLVPFQMTPNPIYIYIYIYTAQYRKNYKNNKTHSTSCWQCCWSRIVPFMWVHDHHYRTDRPTVEFYNNVQ